MLRTGELLNNRYRLDAFLASGGMGEVWRATDVILGRTVAVKILLPALLADPGFVARFRAEARILAGFRHPNVVDVYDFGESTVDGRTAAYLVMAYVDGEPLSHRIETAGRLPVIETLSVVAQAADALDAAHAGGVVHRDVKPGNLLVHEDGTVVLVDFGVARSAAITSITAADAVPGTVLYMAPEQVSGKPVSPATDVYALGAVAYQCLSGAPPFSGEAPMEIALRHLNDEPPPLPTDLPEPVRVLVGRAMAKDPAERYPSAAALAAAARAAAAAVGGHVPPATGAAAAGIAAAGATTVAGLPATDGGTVVDLPAVGNGARPVGSAPVPPTSRTTGGRFRTATSSRKRIAALAGAAAILVVGAILAVVLALNLGDDGEPGGPTQPGEARRFRRRPAPPSPGPAAPARPRAARRRPARHRRRPSPGRRRRRSPSRPTTQEPEPTPTGGGTGTAGTGGGDGGGASGAP